jgi:hypothetical protein
MCTRPKSATGKRQGIQHDGSVAQTLAFHAEADRKPQYQHSSAIQGRSLWQASKPPRHKGDDA